MMNPAVLETGTVLIAEDDSRDVLLMQRAFRKAHVPNPIQVVSDGSEAVAYLSGQGRFADRQRYPMPLLLLLDLRMPKSTGYDVLNWLAKQSHLEGLHTAVVTSM